MEFFYNNDFGVNLPHQIKNRRKLETEGNKFLEIMKKIFLTIAIISITGKIYSQNKSALEILADVLTTSLKIANPNSELSNGGTVSKNKEWSEWRATTSYSKIKYSVICYEKLRDLNKFSWGIKFRNDYGQFVSGDFIIGSTRYEAEKNFFAGQVPNDGSYHNIDYRGGLPWFEDADMIILPDQYIVSSDTNIYIDVSRLSFKSEGGAPIILTDSGQVCLKCKRFTGNCTN